MSFCVALQSAIFYVVACTPCSKVRHRQKTSKQAKRKRAEKARNIAEQPHLYAHPDPMQTNEWWAEEINLGPSLPKKGKAGSGSNSKNASQHGVASVWQSVGDAGDESNRTINSGDAPAMLKARRSSGTTQARVPSTLKVAVAEEDTTSASLSKTASVSTGDDWNLKRYQREDEELWGQDFSWGGTRLMDAMAAIKQAGTNAGRYVESKLGLEKQTTAEDRYNFYGERNPPVNDYHPPVVRSRPSRKDANRWMLQPPPPAKVMEGKVPVSRSSSFASVTSRRTLRTMGSPDYPTLGRLVGERAVNSKIRKGETPAEVEFRSITPSQRPTSKRTEASTTLRSRDLSRRSRSLSIDTDDGLSDAVSHQTRRLRPANVTITAGSDEEEAYAPAGSNTSELLTQSAQLPQLETILDSDQFEKQLTRTTPQGERIGKSSLHGNLSSAKTW